MVRLYVNVQFQVKPLSTGTSSSQTKKKFPKKYQYGSPQGVCQVWSLQHKSQLNIKFQVKPLSTGTSSSQTKKKFLKNSSMGPPKVCTKFGVHSTSLIQQSAVAAVAAGAAGLYKSRGSNLSQSSNSSRTNNNNTGGVGGIRGRGHSKGMGSI